MSVENNIIRAPQLGGQYKNQITGQEPELSGKRSQVLPPLIVYVDTMESLRMRIHRGLIVNAGYRVQNFERVIDALHFCQETPPDLLIIVLDLSSINDDHLCQLIRNDENLNYMPILMHSLGDNRRSHLQRASSNSYFINKPCGYTGFVDMIDKIMIDKRLAVPSQRENIFEYVLRNYPKHETTDLETEGENPLAADETIEVHTSYIARQGLALYKAIKNLCLSKIIPIVRPNLEASTRIISPAKNRN